MWPSISFCGYDLPGSYVHHDCEYNQIRISRVNIYESENKELKVIHMCTVRPLIFGSNWWQILPSLNPKSGSYDVIADLHWIWNISSEKTLQKDKMTLSWTNNFNFQFWKRFFPLCSALNWNILNLKVHSTTQYVICASFCNVHQCQLYNLSEMGSVSLAHNTIH